MGFGKVKERGGMEGGEEGSETPETITTLENVTDDGKGWKTTIAAGALLPHEIIAQLMDSEAANVAELQWERMVNDVAEKGKLTNCMAICDVSGSMTGTPMEVSVALGLLISVEYFSMKL